MGTYAIIQSGSQQFRVQEGDVIDVDLLSAEEAEVVKFEQVLCVGIGEKAVLGAPTVAGAYVQAEVLAHIRGPKVISYKYKQRKNYRRKVGHRQNYTQVKITGVQHGA